MLTKSILKKEFETRYCANRLIFELKKSKLKARYLVSTFESDELKPKIKIKVNSKPKRYQTVLLITGL